MTRGLERPFPLERRGSIAPYRQACGKVNDPEPKPMRSDELTTDLAVVRRKQWKKVPDRPLGEHLNNRWRVRQERRRKTSPQQASYVRMHCADQGRQLGPLMTLPPYAGMVRRSGQSVEVRSNHTGSIVIRAATVPLMKPAQEVKTPSSTSRSAS